MIALRRFDTNYTTPGHGGVETWIALDRAIDHSGMMYEVIARTVFTFVFLKA